MDTLPSSDSREAALAEPPLGSLSSPAALPQVQEAERNRSDTFSKFSVFPHELQDKIWEMALEPALPMLVFAMSIPGSPRRTSGLLEMDDAKHQTAKALMEAYRASGAAVKRKLRSRLPIGPRKSDKTGRLESSGECRCGYGSSSGSTSHVSFAWDVFYFSRHWTNSVIIGRHDKEDANFELPNRRPFMPQDQYERLNRCRPPHIMVDHRNLNDILQKCLDPFDSDVQNINSFLTKFRISTTGTRPLKTLTAFIPGTQPDWFEDSSLSLEDLHTVPFEANFASIHAELDLGRYQPRQVAISRELSERWSALKRMNENLLGPLAIQLPVLFFATRRSGEAA